MGVTSTANYPESAGIQLFHLAHLDSNLVARRKRGEAFRVVWVKLKESGEGVAKSWEKLAKQATYDRKRNT